MSIGSQISARRKQMSMTQQDLAEKMEVSFQAVSAWERDEYLPETDKLKGLAKALNTTVGFLMEESIYDIKHWELKDAMFSVDNMLRRVKMYAQAKKYKETQKAIKLMLTYHEGTYRKSTIGEKIPYVIHPLMMACHAFALGIDSDDLIAAILLHDVVEDCDVTTEELDVNDVIKEAVRAVSFEVQDGMSKEESKKVYYDQIGKNKLASVVKLLDRCNNVSTMATGFTPNKIARYVDETEKYVLPLLDIVKREYDEYYDATFLIKYQIFSVLETIKRIL